MSKKWKTHRQMMIFLLGGSRFDYLLLFHQTLTYILDDYIVIKFQF